MEEGMTDRQFVSYRRMQLSRYEDMLRIAEKTNADAELVKMIERDIEDAEAAISA